MTSHNNPVTETCPSCGGEIGYDSLSGGWVECDDCHVRWDVTKLYE